MAGARFSNVNKSFGGISVLKNVDLDFQDHQFTVVLGPSGCGKTTMLRLLAGLEDVSSGEIWIGDRNVTALEPRERDVAMVFQNYALYPTMSAAQNMGFGLKAKKMPAEKIRARVDETAEMLGIAHLLNRRPKELSGGQQQRVAIGRAIVREPEIFLFDEPLSNLDAKLRVTTRTELLRLQKRLNATTVYVTHDQEEAMTMADQIVVMNQGTIEQIGSPSEIYFRPASAMVAGFIGSPTMNFLIGSRSGETIETAIGPIRTAELASSEASVAVGVRPDDLRFPEDLQSDQIACQASFSVEFIELLGARGIVTLTAAGIEFKGVFEQRDLHRFQEGATVELALSSGELHVFSKNTGRRL